MNSIGFGGIVVSGSSHEYMRAYYERLGVKNGWELHRLRHPETAKATAQRWQRDHVATSTEHKRLSNLRYPEKLRARRIVWNEIEQGRLIRPETCGRCHMACKPNAHHRDYSRPLEVEWLCRPCHEIADRET